MIPAGLYRKTRGIIRRGLAASKPSFLNVLEGTVYYSTDTQSLERSSGAAWESIAPGVRHIGCVSYKNALQSIPNDLYTTITFEVDTYDTDNIHNVAVNNTRFVAPVTGYYFSTIGLGFLTATWASTPGAGSQLGVKVKKNGTDIPGSGTFNPALTNGINQWVFTTVGLYMTAGEYIEIDAYQRNSVSPGNISIYGDTIPSNFNSGIRFLYMGN